MSDGDYRSPSAGGCWICKTGNGWEDDDMEFDMEFDTFAHPSCLEEEGVESVTEYEMRPVDTDSEKVNDT